MLKDRPVLRHLRQRAKHKAREGLRLLDCPQVFISKLEFLQHNSISELISSTTMLTFCENFQNVNTFVNILEKFSKC